MVDLDGGDAAEPAPPNVSGAPHRFSRRSVHARSVLELAYDATTLLQLCHPLPKRIKRGLNEIRRQQKRRSPKTWQGHSGLWRSMNSTFKERLMELYHRRRATCARHG